MHIIRNAEKILALIKQKLFPKHFCLSEQTKQLYGKHHGERCFILGAGSSINKQDITKLKGEIVLSVSNTFVHKDFLTICPRYHILPHIDFGHGNLYSQDQIARWLKEMEKKTGQAEMILHIGDKKTVDNYQLFENRIIHWVEYVLWEDGDKHPIDLARIPRIWSVSETAITTALYLGFDKIYLLGFDHDWFNGPMVYFFNYKTDHSLGPTDENLSFADAEFQMRRHADMFKKYKYFYNIKKNIFNANANPQTYVDVFPKIDFDSLFPKK